MSMTKRELELENARLRGQIEVLRDELRQARSARTVEGVPYVPANPTPSIVPYWPHTIPYWPQTDPLVPSVTWCDTRGEAQ